MDAETADELQTLRSRAYGPSADIDTDSASLRRLRELEGLVRAPAPSSLGTPAEEDSSQSAGDQWPADAPGVVARASDDDSTAAPDSHYVHTADSVASVPDPSAGHHAEPRRRLSWRVRLVWAASIVATAGIATALTWGLLAVSPVSASSGSPQIATLRPAPLVEVPSGWFGAGPSSRAWEFYGLTLFETANGMFAGAGAGDCIAVVTTEAVPAEHDLDQNSWSISGLAYTACRVGAFPATVEIAVDSNAPEELRAAYPDSALQFVKQGDQIGVFLDEG